MTGAAKPGQGAAEAEYRRSASAGGGRQLHASLPSVIPAETDFVPTEEARASRRRAGHPGGSGILRPAGRAGRPCGQQRSRCRLPAFRPGPRNPARAGWCWPRANSRFHRIQGQLPGHYVSVKKLGPGTGRGGQGQTSHRRVPVVLGLYSARGRTFAPISGQESPLLRAQAGFQVPAKDRLGGPRGTAKTGKEPNLVRRYRGD